MSDNGRDDDGQLVDEPGLERLPDDVRPSYDVHISAVGGLDCSVDGRLHPGHEDEGAVLRLFLRRCVMVIGTHLSSEWKSSSILETVRVAKTHRALCP